MSNYDNTNRGAIFKNEQKSSDKQPDYKGKINVDGVDKQISLWVTTSKEGKKFFSVQVSEPYQPQQQAPQPQAAVSQSGDEDDDSGLPF
jgi:uncharacterized protein (DUF736 family)